MYNTFHIFVHSINLSIPSTYHYCSKHTFYHINLRLCGMDDHSRCIPSNFRLALDPPKIPRQYFKITSDRSILEDTSGLNNDPVRQSRRVKVAKVVEGLRSPRVVFVYDLANCNTFTWIAAYHLGSVLAPSPPSLPPLFPAFAVSKGQRVRRGSVPTDILYFCRRLREYDQPFPEFKNWRTRSLSLFLSRPPRVQLNVQRPWKLFFSPLFFLTPCEKREMTRSYQTHYFFFFFFC